LEKYRTLLEIPEINDYEEDIKVEESKYKKMIEKVIK
jgi:hypothetical protein